MMKCKKTPSSFIILKSTVHSLFPFLFLLAVLGGCITPEKKLGKSWEEDITHFSSMGQSGPNSARISCFFTLKDEEVPAVKMEVADIEVFVDNTWIMLTHGPLELDSKAIGGRQLFLGSIAVPPGHYNLLRLTVTAGELMKADGKYAVIVTEPFTVEVGFTTDLILDAEDSKSILISWDVEKSLQTANTLNPVLAAIPPLKQLNIDLVLAACPDINTIFVIRADKNWVVDSFGLKGRPTYLAVDPDASRERLYVLAVQERMILVVDLSNYKIIDFYSAPLNDNPTYMTISPDGQNAFLLDEKSGYVSRLDLVTGQIISRAQIGYQPQYAVFLPEQNLLAVSLSLSQKVLLLDPVDLTVLSTIHTGSSPQGLAVSGNLLYLTEYADNSISIFDLSNRTNKERIAVGSGPRRILSIGNQFYVSNYLDDSLSVLIPEQFGIIQEIYNLGRPLEMAYQEFYKKIYVTDEDVAGLAVIDANSNILKDHIVLGAKPLGLAVIQ